MLRLFASAARQGLACIGSPDRPRIFAASWRMPAVAGSPLPLMAGSGRCPNHRTKEFHHVSSEESGTKQPRAQPMAMRTTTRKAAAKKKTTRRKTATRKVATRKVAAKKTTRRKIATRKVVKRKTAAKKKTAKRKTATRKAAVRKTTRKTRKAPVRRARKAAGEPAPAESFSGETEEMD
jgi:hypothetical protein